MEQLQKAAVITYYNAFTIMRSEVSNKTIPHVCIWMRLNT